MPRVSSMMMGTMIRTVVTLSRNAEMTAVTAQKRIMMRSGCPPVNLAMRTVIMAKKPVFFNTATIPIMPISSMMVS